MTLVEREEKRLNKVLIELNKDVDKTLNEWDIDDDVSDTLLGFIWYKIKLMFKN